MNSLSGIDCKAGALALPVLLAFLRGAAAEPVDFVFTGRLHYDYVHLESEAGDYEDWEVRRARAGFRTHLDESFEFKGEVELDLNEFDPFYAGLTDFYLAWRPDREWTLKAGKQAALFTLEGSTSSNDLLTLERSNLANNLWFPALFIPGISVAREKGDYRFDAGIFSGGSASPEFGEFDGSAFGIFRVSRDFATRFDAKAAILGVHWVVQEPDPDNTFTRPHEQVASLNFRYEKGRWGWQGDLARSIGAFAQPDLTGVVLMPYLNLGERWQLVSRATFLESNGADGIALARYENRLSSERGDSFQEYYVGVNHLWKGHHLKWQSGISHTRLHDSGGGGGDYEGWGCSSGIRISW